MSSHILELPKSIADTLKGLFAEKGQEPVDTLKGRFFVVKNQPALLAKIDNEQAKKAIKDLPYLPVLICLENDGDTLTFCVTQEDENSFYHWGSSFIAGIEKSEFFIPKEDVNESLRLKILYEDKPPISERHIHRVCSFS